ncbi:MAG: UPF0182 family protein [Spirochaetales bacterium]|nr:MAG: UPF0182 family protein [Spirochaetales bacterium]
MKKGKKLIIILAAIAVAAAAIFTSVNIWLNAAWFSKLGFGQVYSTIIGSKVGLWAGFFIIFFLFSGINIRAAFRRAEIKGTRIQLSGEPIELNRKTIGIISIAVVFLLSIFMANNGSKQWETVLKFFNATGFDLKDPIYSRDISYYVFILPLYLFLKNWGLLTLILTIVPVSLLYLSSGQIKWEKKKLVSSDKARRHVLFLLLLVTVVIGWNFWLARYQLLFSTSGLIFGPDFTAAEVVRPLYIVMMAISLLTAVFVFISMVKSSLKIFIIGAGILVGSAIILTGIVPVLVQQFSVKPNELQKESPYIKNNILFTREGYGISGVDKQLFPVEDSLTAEDFGAGTGITENIRLWDQRPLMATFAQLQGFRLYYDFNSVNVDRYHFGNEYKQVMVAAREINTNNLPPTARTWINEKLQYTHGYGIVMAPVTQIGQEGLPELIIKDIPPKLSVPVKIDRPEIYYGQKTFSYVFGNTNIPEFDYPKGNENVTTHYEGTGGLDIKSGWRKLLLALHFKSTNILFTNYLKPTSKIMIYRSIDQRVRMLARFLRFDSDPYIVLSEGKLFWMLDAYTTTDKYPYSNLSKDGYNYIRNSVKITVDAYNGDVNFYVVDKKDPLISTYKKIFPGMFKDFAEMPEDLRLHVRYPLDLFQAQSEIYAVYHMTDPVVFYNKEDEWSIPQEIYDQGPTAMNPYYAIIRFADQTVNDQYVLMLPFTPSNKNNMVSWVAAMCDPENYGKIIEYQFPKEKLIFGPMQIESRIDQNTEISQLFTLWGQKGSTVIRGNLLVYPVRNSLLYVEPIYLQAEQSKIPELKRVIAAYQNRIGVGLDLREALNAVFGGVHEPEASAASAESPKLLQALNVQELIDKAVENFNAAQNQLRAGDFAGYGDYINRLQKTLEDLQKEWMTTQ